MNTYLWPKVLGGGEHEEYRHVSGETEAPLGTVAFLVDDKLVCIAVSLLTEVRPEPGIAAVVLDRHDRAWQHVAFGGRGDWCCTVDDLGADWEELNREHGPLLELGSAPEPVEYPWKYTDTDGDQLMIDPDLPADVLAVTSKSRSGNAIAVLVPADLLLRAAWTAANAARKATS